MGRHVRTIAQYRARRAKNPNGISFRSASQPASQSQSQSLRSAEMPFEYTSIARGQELMRAMRGRMSGLAQPTYVLDIPGGHGKVPIGPQYLSAGEGANYTVEAADGCRHCYRDHGPDVSGQGRGKP